jgi:hypothetical protein
MVLGEKFGKLVAYNLVKHSGKKMAWHTKVLPASRLFFNQQKLVERKT